jgi:hypothetical protein
VPNASSSPYSGGRDGVLHTVAARRDPAEGWCCTGQAQDI